MSCCKKYKNFVVDCMSEYNLNCNFSKVSLIKAVTKMYKDKDINMDKLLCALDELVEENKANK